jgi:cobalt/nickel transport system permease protein
MHMADALISPEVGGTMWVISAGAIAYCSKKVNKTLDDFKVPLMGVMGAFVFAAQMINFTIPGTGSSGHIIGSLLLSVLLGPYAALLVISSILLVQALIFADGGLLSLGCNIFNMGIIPCLITYPLLYRIIAGKPSEKSRIWFASILTAIIGLQLGAFFVVLETWFSGIAELPFKGFILLMLPIHLPIGLIEGMVTASVLTRIKGRRPELLTNLQINNSPAQHSYRNIIMTMLLLTFFVGGVISWFASEKPDGLEWAIGKTTGKEELNNPSGKVHTNSEYIQKSTSLFPDYGFKNRDNIVESGELQWEYTKLGTSISGITGTLIILILAFMIGSILKYKSSKIIKMREKKI